MRKEILKYTTKGVFSDLLDDREVYKKITSILTYLKKENQIYATGINRNMYKWYIQK